MVMELQNHLVLFIALILLLKCNRCVSLTRSSFPKDFIFGSASSAYQYEGAANRDGKGPSGWDTFTRLHPEEISDYSSGNVSEDFYYRYKEDVALMKEVGFGSFRFSISWPRVLPKGKLSGGVNQKGVDFYNNLIDELLSNGLVPFVTLFHWDLPQALDDEYGGFLSPNILVDFRDYAEFCFKEFGDRVKYWSTLNEPDIYSSNGYANGYGPPHRCSSYIGDCPSGDSATEPYVVMHHMLLAHATAVKLYRRKYKDSQNGTIGLATGTQWMVPKYETTECHKAALRALDFSFGWIVDPITYGVYPQTMRSIVGHRLPNFTEAESELLKGSMDFLGINYYFAYYAEDVSSVSHVNLSYTTDSLVNLTSEKDGTPIGQLTTMSWFLIYPKGIQELMLYVKRKYNNPPIYIAENGLADNSTLTMEDALKDTLRISYFRRHLWHLLKAIKEGVDVRGYYAWTFLDAFEWDLGYTARFGLTYVDYENQLQRYLKDSALWFKKFLQSENFTKKLYTET